MKNQSVKKIGVFIPPPVQEGENASTHKSGIGRLPKKTRENLILLIEDACKKNNFLLYKDLNFQDSVIIDGKVVCNGICLNDLDLYVWYGEIDRRVNSYDLLALKTISADTKVIRNPHDYEVALDKYSAMTKLRSKGLDVAENVLFDHKNVEKVKDIITKWERGILKPRRGGFGKGVTLIPNYSILRDFVEYVDSTSEAGSPDGAYFLEKYYENDISKWASATVINGEIAYGYRKRNRKVVDMGEGAKKVYDENEVGGDVELCELSEAHKALALKAARILNIDILGFDMIWHNGKPIIIDVNTFPGFYEELFKEIGREPSREFFKVIEKHLR